MGALAVIPAHPTCAVRLPLDRHPCKERHLVECCIGKLAQCRRVAMRGACPRAGCKPDPGEKTARNCLAIVTIAATILRIG